MQLTTKKLKQLIRQELLKETNRADLEFLRDMSHTKEPRIQDRHKLHKLYQQAQQDSDVITMQYIEDMVRQGIWPRNPHPDLQLIKGFFEYLADQHDEEQYDEQGVRITRRHLTDFIQYHSWEYEDPGWVQRSSEEAKKEADLLWPLTIDYYASCGLPGDEGCYLRGPYFDLEGTPY